MLVKLPTEAGERVLACRQVVIGAKGEIDVDGELVDLYTLKPWQSEDGRGGGRTVTVSPEDGEEEMQLLVGTKARSFKHGFTIEAHREPHGISFSARRDGPLFHSYGPSAHQDALWRPYDHHKTGKGPVVSALVLQSPARYARLGLPSGPRMRLSGMSA